MSEKNKKCEVCGKRKATKKITAFEYELWLCDKCFEEKLCNP